MNKPGNNTDGSDDFGTPPTTSTNNLVSPTLPPRTPEFTVFVKKIANLLYCNFAGFVPSPPETVMCLIPVLISFLLLLALDCCLVYCC